MVDQQLRCDDGHRVVERGGQGAQMADASRWDWGLCVTRQGFESRLLGSHQLSEQIVAPAVSDAIHMRQDS